MQMKEALQTVVVAEFRKTSAVLLDAMNRLFTFSQKWEKQRPLPFETAGGTINAEAEIKPELLKLKRFS